MNIYSTKEEANTLTFVATLRSVLYRENKEKTLRKSSRKALLLTGLQNIGGSTNFRNESINNVRRCIGEG